MEAELVSAIVHGRQASRRESASTFAHELMVGGGYRLRAPLRVSQAEDVASATRAGKSFSASFLSAVLDGMSEDKTVSAAAVIAARTQLYRLERISTTEIASSFNRARRDIVAAEAEWRKTRS